MPEEIEMPEEVRGSLHMTDTMISTTKSGRGLDNRNSGECVLLEQSENST